MVFESELPKGFKKGASGWMLVVPTSKDKKINKIKQENTELKSRLEQLEAAVEQLVSKKKK